MSLKSKLAILFFVISFLPSLVTGVLTYNNYEKLFEKDEFKTLNYIVDYKRNEITLYFSALIDNIKSTQSSWCIRENLPAIIEFAEDPSNPRYVSAKKILDERFQPTQKTWGLIDIMLTDTTGRVVYGTSQEHHHLLKRASDPGEKSFGEGIKGIYITDMFRDLDESGRTKMFISAPDFNYDGSLLGVIIFEIDLSRVYTLIQDPTGLETTGETLIGMKTGEEILYLNPLRHDPKAAFNMSVKIGSEFGRPIQKAIQGQGGCGRSVDYRGVNVIAAWRYLPELRWGLVAKIDQSEAFAEIALLKNTLYITIGILFALCLIVSRTIARTISGSREKLNKEIDERKKTSKELEEYKNHLEDLVNKRTSEISGLSRNIEFVLGATNTGLDIIDSEYNIIYVDPEWQKVYGDPKGKKCYEYFMGRNTACPVCGLREAFETKKPVVTEEVLVKEGNRPIQVTTIPYQDANGNWLVAEINVDITERKHRENELKKYRDHLEDLVKTRTEEVHKAEKRLEFALEASYIGAWELDLSDHTAFHSIEHDRIFGYTEMLPRWTYEKFLEHVLPEDRETVDRDFRHAIETKADWRFECRIKRADGAIRWIWASGRNQPDPQGKAGYMTGIVQDITERKKSEDAIQISETRYRRLFESAKDGILILNAETGKIVDANPFIKDILNYTEEELIGKELWEIGSLKDIANSKEAFLELKNKGYVRYNNLPLETKDGQVKEVEFVSNQYKVDHTEVIQCNIRDVTERRRIETALEASEANYRAIFESASDAIVIRNIESYAIVDVNEQACELFCYPKEELMNLGPEVLIPSEDPHGWKYIKPIFDKASSGEPQSVELLMKDKADRTFWAEAHIKRAVIGGVYRLLSVVHDISERKDSENEIIALNRTIAQANEELKKLALIDAHTGLYNYHYYSGVIESEFARAQRQGGRLSLIMMDIDYFKSINDVYGHQFGDLILKQFAELLKKAVRLYDTVIRFGGEEFIIIVPGAGNEEAIRLAKRVLSAVNSFSFGNDEHSVKLKASIASGSYPDDPRIKNNSDFINIADSILSKAKEDGGNRAYSSLDYGTSESAKLKEKEPDIASLKDKIVKLTTRGNQSVAEAIFAFAKTIELKDRYTGEHVDDTVHYAVLIAEKLGLDDREIELIKYAAALHDLGKVGIPEAILQKPGKLTAEESNIIKLHPQIGADIIRPIHFLHDIIPAILHHHEHWDGSGYPTGLKKESIPLAARIIAVADAYQAMISDRSYRKALGKEKAIEELKNNSGTQFDHKIVTIFLRVLHSEKKSLEREKK